MTGMFCCHLSCCHLSCCHLLTVLLAVLLVYTEGTCECNCNSLEIRKETGRVGTYLWSSRYGLAYYATQCGMDSACLCETCPLAFLPEEGEYSPSFYGDTMSKQGEILLPLTSVLAIVPAVEGLSSCQKWVGCVDGYVLKKGVCLKCSDIVCELGWVCARDTVTCVPCELPSGFTNAERVMWSADPGVECGVGCKAGFYLT